MSDPGSDYGRRRPRPKPQVPRAPLPKSSAAVSFIPAQRGSTISAANPGADFPMVDGSNIPFDQLPQWVRDLEGSTIAGRALAGGFGSLPQHGGLGADGDYSSGTRDGWGNNRHAPMPRSLSEWVPPTILDREFLAQISAEFRPGNQGRESPLGQPIAGGLRTGDPFISSSGLDRQRVDSFVLGSPADGIVPRSSSGPLQGIANLRDMGTLGSASFSPSASSIGVQQIGVGIPRTSATGFTDLSESDRFGGHIMPGIGGVMASGPLPPAGQFDIYGNRQSGPLRPKRSSRL